MMFAIEFPNIWWNNWPLPMWSSSNLVVFKKGLDVPGLNVLLYCEHNNITFLRIDHSGNTFFSYYFRIPLDRNTIKFA